MSFRDTNLEPLVKIVEHSSKGQLADSTSPLVTSSLNNLNRADDIRRDVDTHENFSVSLEDIDGAILTHLSKNINLSIIDAGVVVNVPIVYNSPEKWKSVQKDGYIRDGQGKLQLPVFAFGRNSFVKNQSLMTMNRYLTYPVVSKYSQVNNYNPINTLHRSDRGKTTETFGITLPDHITVTYSCICQAEYVSQVNAIVEKINFATEEYWGDKNRFKFRTYAGDYNFTTENTEGDDRVVKAEFQLTVQAYLLPKSFEDRKETVRRFLSPRRIKWGIEVVDGEPINATRRTKTPTQLVNNFGKSWQLNVDENGGLYTTGTPTFNPAMNSIEIISTNGEIWYLKVDEDGSLFLEKK